MLKYRIVPMKRLFLTGFYVFFVCWQALLAQEVQKLDLFEPLEVVQARHADRGVPLKMDQARLRAIYEQGLPDRIQFQIPLGDQTLNLPLHEVSLFHPDFQLLDARGAVIAADRGRHYQAFLGDTLLALSIFPEGLQAQMSTGSHNFTLTADPQRPSSYYWIRTADAQRMGLGLCQTADDLDEDLKREMSKTDQSVQSRSALPPLDAYFEMDHFIYLEQDRSPERCLLLMAGLFNSVSQIFRLEGIGLRLSGLKVWDEPDPFSTEDARKALFSFRSYLPKTYTESERDWDMAMLLSRYTNEAGLAPNGGLANINSLCNLRRRQAYANLGSIYQDFPVYSWSVFVIAHEFGHTIASPHSHNCFWPGGPLDDCYCQEGSCEPGPSVVEQGGGTIMSYCYLQEPFSNFCSEFPSGKNPGVNFLRAFGQYPADLMRQRIQEKDCLRDRPVEQLPNLRVRVLDKLSRINDTVSIEGLVVQNTGTMDAFLFRIGIFQGADLVATIPIQQLAAGDSIQIYHDFILPRLDRTRDFSFQLDILQEVSEWHEGDNFYTYQLEEEKDYPLLSLSSGSDWMDTDYFFLIPDILLTNRGWAGSDTIDIRCYLGQDGVPLLMLSQKKLTTLEPASDYHFKLAAYEPALNLPAGKYELSIEWTTNGIRHTFQWPAPIRIRGAVWEWFRK